MKMVAACSFEGLAARLNRLTKSHTRMNCAAMFRDEWVVRLVARLLGRCVVCGNLSRGPIQIAHAKIATPDTDVRRSAEAFDIART